MQLMFPDFLRLIDERTAAFCAAVAASDLDAQVPSCPEWTLYDLVQHLGDGRRKWAAIVGAGPASAPPDRTPSVAPRERDAAVAWMTEPTRELLNALEEAGPERGCWTPWGDSQSPQTSGAAARRQLQEISMHTYDAQLTAGDPQPLPAGIALDGVDEFLSTCVATTSAWPHEPAVIDYHVTEGRSWRLWLDADGARAGDVTEAEPDATGRGAAADFLMWFYGRTQGESLKLDGDLRVLDRLVEWEPA
ncbi:maleylpyruvate isomerase family mycothiol-dependent enzyme [Lentzea roselyniae]|uniref:Maleylpyruvate isomerase family mycothiol-dependent enzyme n=2 Tax=Lentzea roselyniae TaxID=531940 RepID=A0ABP7BPW4_9PSEU